MKIFENYRTAMGKYGRDLVIDLYNSRVHPDYLLAACRFIIEYNVPKDQIVNEFKEWADLKLR